MSATLQQRHHTGSDPAVPCCRTAAALAGAATDHCNNAGGCAQAGSSLVPCMVSGRPASMLLVLAPVAKPDTSPFQRSGWLPACLVSVASTTQQSHGVQPVTSPCHSPGCTPSLPEPPLNCPSTSPHPLPLQAPRGRPQGTSSGRPAAAGQRGRRRASDGVECEHGCSHSSSGGPLGIRLWHSSWRKAAGRWRRRGWRQRVPPPRDWPSLVHCLSQRAGGAVGAVHAAAVGLQK